MREEDWFRANGPDAPALLDHLRAHGRDYDLVLFWAFRYAPTYFGLPLVADRAILVPQPVESESTASANQGILELARDERVGVIGSTADYPTVVTFLRQYRDWLLAGMGGARPSIGETNDPTVPGDPPTLGL